MISDIVSGDLYKTHRHVQISQLSKLLADHLANNVAVHRIIDRVEPMPIDGLVLPGDELLHVPAHRYFEKSAPYTSASPNPPRKTLSPGSSNRASDSAAWADAQSGDLSVGLSGGDRVWGGFGTQPGGNHYHADMPDRWLLGDALQTSAAIIQTVPVPGKLVGGVFAGRDPKTVSIIAEFLWKVSNPATHNDPIALCLGYAAGDATAPHNGLIAMGANFTLMISLVSATGKILKSVLRSANALSVVVDATHPGNVQAQGNLPTLSWNWFFDGNSTKTFSILADIPFDQNAASIVVEAGVFLMGGRSSIGNAKAGWVGGEFSTPTMLSYVAAGEAFPFSVHRIIALSS